jgi:hypothetical protein
MHHQLLLDEVLSRDRTREREVRNRSEYLRRLAVVRRRQRRVDSARRALAALTIR